MSNSTDVNGRPWAKLSELKAGDLLEADGDFTCLSKGQVEMVFEDKDGLAIPCADGGHWLRGQADDGEHLVGFYKVS